MSLWKYHLSTESNNSLDTTLQIQVTPVTAEMWADLELHLWAVRTPIPIICVLYQSSSTPLLSKLVDFKIQKFKANIMHAVWSLSRLAIAFQDRAWRNIWFTSWLVVKCWVMESQVVDLFIQLLVTCLLNKNSQDFYLSLHQNVGTLELKWCKDRNDEEEDVKQHTMNCRLIYRPPSYYTLFIYIIYCITKERCRRQ